MAKHVSGKANQQLYFASIHLQAISTAEANEALLHKTAVIEAEKQAALSCLLRAYRSFIWEICQTYELETHADMSLAQVQAAATEQAKSITELNRFAALERESGSWLQQLLQAYASMSRLQPQQTAAQPAADGLIAVQKRDETSTPEKILNWHKALKSEIETLRTQLAEW